MTFNSCRSPAWRVPVMPVLLAAVLALGACGERKDRAGTGVAARVDGDEITAAQLHAVLQQQRGLRSEQVEPAARQLLERLIEQQLAARKAEDMKLDREPLVQQQFEAARREVLARAYAEKVGEAAAKPTADEVKKFYEDKPALFAERRIYSINEVAVEARPDQVVTLRDRLAASRDIGDFIEHLKANEIRFVVNQAVRAAEQLPPQAVDAIARLRDGQAMVVPTAVGMQVVVLAGSRSQPLTFEQARPAIEQMILTDRKRKLIEDDVKKLRAGAKIEYMGRFAEPAASAPASASAPTR